jgi:hypothetical protein
VQTMPGKGWNSLLRLYAPLEPWFDKTWKRLRINGVTFAGAEIKHSACADSDRKSAAFERHAETWACPFRQNVFQFGMLANPDITVAGGSARHCFLVARRAVAMPVQSGGDLPKRFRP